MLQSLSSRAFVLLAVLLLVACSDRGEHGKRTAAANGDETERTALDTASANGIPGIGLVVVNAQAIVELQVRGVRILGDTDALHDGDPFHIGSVTKPITATIIAQLVEEGVLHWDTEVADVLAEPMETAMDEYTGITLAHLLAHEAGLPPMEEEHELELVPELKGDRRDKRYQFARWILQQDPIVPPLQAFRYSNAHFIVAAAMAEQATGRTWEQLVRSRIFDDLGMERAGFGWPARANQAGPWGHRYVDGRFIPIDPDGDYALPDYFGPAGDIHASLGDIGRFLQAYLRAWAGQGEFLDSSTVRRLWTRRLASGLGWGSTQAFGFDPVATFSGSADTFLTVVVVIPDADLAVAVAANAFSDDVEKTVVTVLKDTVNRHLAAD